MSIGSEVIAPESERVFAEHTSISAQCHKTAARIAGFAYTARRSGCRKIPRKLMEGQQLLIGSVTPFSRCTKMVQVSRLCHSKPVKTGEIEGNQVRSKIAASCWLARGYVIFSCACGNGKNGFQDRRFQPLTHSSSFYLTDSINSHATSQ